MLIHYLYPIQVINPGWLTWRRAAWLFVPWLLLNLLLIVSPFHFRTLSSFGDMVEHIGEFNVWFRLLILLLGIVPYCFMLFYIPYNYRKSSADWRWIFIYAVGIQGIGLLSSLFILTRSTAVSIAHVSYCILFCVVITYRELFLRIAVPVSVQAAPASPSVPAGREIAPDNGTCPLAARLNELMTTEELWRDPDMSIAKLSVLLGTNRNRIRQVLHEEEYESYTEYINRRRIDEFRMLADDGKIVNIQDAFFQVGFRSKMTALRNFKEFTGMTPTEYLQSILKEDEKPT
ncbi:MAG: helix-turn-helix domain-containing protein [Bacteroides sp.]|nr:helix-turn-helix domain-containing protein [Bacteroides sp.]